MENLARLEEMALRLPQAERVDIAAWDDHPTFRVNGKNFVFADGEGKGMSLKLPKEEAEAVVASDPDVTPAGYGLGRSGWVSIELGSPDEDRWLQVEEWVRTSYTLVAPKKLARIVLAEDEAGE